MISLVGQFRPRSNPDNPMKNGEKILGVSIRVSVLAAEIHDCGQYLKRNFSAQDLAESGTDFIGTDCRLQVQDGGWQLHTGSADFDQDHRGAWSCASIPRGCTWKEAREIARDLLNDCAESASQMGDEESEN